MTRQIECSGPCSPLGAACRGAAAGLAATLLLSALARVLPGMSLDPKQAHPDEDGIAPPRPDDPFNHAQVEEWQQRSQAPAAFRPRQGGVGEVANAGVEWTYSPAATLERHRSSGAGNGAAVTPASVLEQPQSPGPEGVAEQFAFKLSSAIFDIDITPIKQPVGMATHLTYGSFWGAVYGLLQATVCQPPLLLGALFGLGVWAVGPGSLVPAMKLMDKPNEEPPLRTAMMVAGHLAYGMALAQVFELEQRSKGV